MEATIAATPSRGHWAWASAPGIEAVEYYIRGGEIFRAPVSNVLDCRTGFRIGRWEGPDRPEFREHIRNIWRSRTAHPGSQLVEA